MQNRLFSAGKFLGALVALLIAVTGYIRIDDWSRGHLNGWLRGGLAILLVVIVAALSIGMLPSLGAAIVEWWRQW
jgi:hypothetical protein